MLEYRVLGSVTVTVDGEPVPLGGARQRRLVAILLVHRNSVVSADHLAEIVFAGEPTPAARTTLRSYVSRLRKAVDGDDAANGRSHVVTRSPGYMLTAPDDLVDTGRFEALVEDGRARLAKDDPVAAATAFRDALALWRGEPYAEFADEDWARPEAQRLAELRLLAHEQLIDAELAAGRPAEVIPALEGLVAEHPLRDGFHERLMLALYRSGRHVDALRAFQDYRRVLSDELGLDPSPALVELERRILGHDPELQLAVPAGRPLRGYRLLERLGTGRDGTVYAASLPGVDRDLVIREYREDLADDPTFVRSFEADAQRVAALRHEAIVPITDYWREPGAAYLVMRRMRGGTLRDRLHRGPLGADQLAALVARVGGALATAAVQGVGHGRVTPESVLFDEHGAPYLGDFLLGRGPLDPSDDVRRFEALVGEGPPALAHEGPPNPYKGLRAFDESDAEDFFGRDAVIDEIVARLGRAGRSGRLVVVVGGSGSGKSSVVRAGVLPRLRAGAVPGSGDWFVTTMVPGSAPFKELAEALRRVAVTELGELADELAADEGGIDRMLRRLAPHDGQVVVAIDQLEEMFTLAPERDQRLFVAGVMRAVSVPDSRLRIVATLRADFYDRPLRFQGLASAMRDATVPVPAMTAAELEEAIVGPADRVGVRVDRPLAAELVAAAIDQPGALPSLQFALYQLAEASPEGPLTVDGYRALGGLDGAIASRAEQLYGTLDDLEREVLRRAFERLVVVGPEGVATRRRAGRPELMALGPGSTVDDLVETWVQARLLTVDRDPATRAPTIEVAHEALLREWPRLRGWIEENREAILALGHLREAAAGWVALGRDRGALFRGARLEHVLDVTRTEVDRLPELEREFLDASREQRDDDQRQEVERVAHQARANRRLRVQLAAIAVALVIAVLGGFVAVDQREEARRQEGVSFARELAAAALANLDADPQRSILLALEAVERTRSDDGTAMPEAWEALHRAVVASRIVMTVPDLGGALDWSPDGKLFVTEGPEESGLIDIRDARTGRSVLSFPAHDPDVNDVAFSPDGSLLGTTGDDGLARLWDAETGEEVWTFRGAEGPVWGPSFSPDGRLFAAGWSADGAVRVLDVTTGDPVQEIGSLTPSFGTAFSPDGRRLAIATFDTGAVVIDVGSGAEVFQIASGGEVAPGALATSGAQGTTSAEWSPDGRWIATSGLDATVRISDGATGRSLFTLFGHTAEVVVADWSPDSSRLVSGGGDGTAKVWEITEDGPRELLSLSAQERGGGVYAAFSPDGSQVMTGNQDISAVTIWDVSRSGDAEWANLPANPAPWSGVDFTRDGGVVTRDVDGSLNVWDAESGRKALGVGGPGQDPNLSAVRVSPDGDLVATAGDLTSLWDLRTGKKLAELGELGTNDVAWSADGDHLAMSDWSGFVVVTDRSGRVSKRLRLPGGFVPTVVRFSPEGRLLAVGRTSEGRPNPRTDRVLLWDWERGEIVATLETGASSMAFDPSGERLAVAKLVGPPEIWDVGSGERVARLSGHTGPAADIAYSPDGGTIGTASSDGTVRLWDGASGAPKLVLRGHTSAVWALAFSPDGSKLVSTGGGGAARIWALDLDDLVDIAKRELTRSLTDAECRQYLHVDRCAR